MTYTDSPLVKVLSGARRSGKSTILKMIADRLKERGIPDKRILTYNLDSLQYDNYTAKGLYDEIKGKLSNKVRIYIFLDEIQEVLDWEKTVNSLITDFNVDLYVTGSNSRMMSSEISTYLTGRYVQFRIFPLSFIEYLEFRKDIIKDNTQSQLTQKEEFTRYLRYGGFPAVHLQEYSVDDAYTIIRDIYNSTVFMDIVKRDQIRRVEQLERIVKFSFENIGRTFSAAAISKYLKSQQRTIDNETVYAYLDKLINAFILHRCSRYDLQGKIILKTQEKFYICDPAMRNSVLGYTPDSVVAMLENIVYLELLRREYTVNIGQLQSGVIDFVAVKRNNKLYIQVAQNNETEETERQYGRLLSIPDNYPKYVLRTDDLTAENYQGVKTMHIADFLLSDKF